MTTFTVYPRGYTTRTGTGTGVTQSQGDASVQTLYELHDQRGVNTSTWNFKRMVLDCALRLFGDFATWLKDQQQNPQIVGFNQEFLKDTLNFIHGKDRVMSVTTWTDLLGDTGTLGKAVNASSLNPSQVLLGRGETTIQILQAWVSRPNGVEDLMQTLYLLFGQARRTAS
jgi:hypothetical protein